MLDIINNIPKTQPVLIAGPTASGKSALALEIATRHGGTILNADALQVFRDWRVLTARPDDADLAAAPHALYGHVPFDAAYSVGAWLRDLAPLLTSTRPIIVGGTGLYFAALTEGLADIPATPPEIRAEAMARLETDGLAALVDELAPETRARIDLQNPMRVTRAWEVQRSTGRSIDVWQAETPPPLIPPKACTRIVLEAPKPFLSPRIEQRFDLMLAHGALEEARAVLPFWDAAAPAAKAIGAPELIAYLQGEIDLDTARGLSITATLQYAKRQRSWFRARMADWQWVTAETL